MGEPSFVVTEQDRETARSGIEIQALAFNIHSPCTDWQDLEGFIDNQIEVIASCYAQIRWLQNIIHNGEFK